HVPAAFGDEESGGYQKEETGRRGDHDIEQERCDALARLGELDAQRHAFRRQQAALAAHHLSRRGGGIRNACATHGVRLLPTKVKYTVQKTKLANAMARR